MRTFDFRAPFGEIPGRTAHHLRIRQERVFRAPSPPRIAPLSIILASRQVPATPTTNHGDCCLSRNARDVRFRQFRRCPRLSRPGLVLVRPGIHLSNSLIKLFHPILTLIVLPRRVGGFVLINVRSTFLATPSLPFLYTRAQNVYLFEYSQLLTIGALL